MNSDKYYTSVDKHGFDSYCCHWPLPSDDEAGEWLVLDHPYNMHFLYNIQHLLHQPCIEVLYRAEYKGDPIRLPNESFGRKYIRNYISVREARLLYRIDAWMEPNALVFSSDCIERAYELLSTFPDIKPNPLIQEIIDIARLWSQDLMKVFEWEGNNNYLDSYELRDKWSALKTSGKLPSFPSGKEIIDKQTEAYNAAKRGGSEYWLILKAAEECLSARWEVGTIRAANYAGYAIAYHRLRKIGRGMGSKPENPSDIAEDNKFLQMEGEVEDKWQAFHLSEIIGESQ